MQFKEYVINWFHEFVELHKSDKGWCDDLFSQLGYDNTYLDNDETPYDFLMAMSDENEIFKALFGCTPKVKMVDDLPDTEGFVTAMLKEVGEDLIKEYDFAEALIEDMAFNCDGYDTPKAFFQDLQYGGCASGMVGMFIYNSNCKDFYIKYIDDMETYMEDWEEEVGETCKNSQKLPHYTWLCWFCYEELAFRIAGRLWGDL